MNIITPDEIKSRLWSGANTLRGSMDASRYKDYMLGLMFYKFLSDKTLETFVNISGVDKRLSDTEIIKQYTEERKQSGENLDKAIKALLGYFILPEFLYQTWIEEINSQNFELSKVSDALNKFESTISQYDNFNDFTGIFKLDLNDSALGSSLKERSDNIKQLILLFVDFNMIDLQKGDVLGDAYEYLIGQFAMESGKKAGEFYTPRQVSEIMAQIVAKSGNNIKSIYDPTVGSGSLLLTVKKHLDRDLQKKLEYYGQEKNTSTYNLTRMNLLLHNVRPEKMWINNGDTLTQDWPEDPKRPNQGLLFDAVVMNPPYSIKNWNKADLKPSDPRFEIAGVLPPNSKGDFAFLLHGLYHLGQNGTMAIVLPHGVLFRGGSEGEIRKRLLEKNYIDTIIGLPSNLFTNTGIPVIIMILKKNRDLNKPVTIIDASKTFIKLGKQNALQEKDIAKIVDVYTTSQEILGYSHLATREEIIENEYNMNIPRYVKPIMQEIPHDVDGHLFGGIPQENINSLKVLQASVPDLLNNFMKEIRPGYLQLSKPINEISNLIMGDQRIIDKTESLKLKVQQYITKYWKLLRNINNETNLSTFMNDMLVEIKTILTQFDYLDIYDGYQIVAEIWKNHLTYDFELIAKNDFYTVSRMREPNIVIKGQGDKKHEEQNGWRGTIIPNALIEKQVYNAEVLALENKKSLLIEIENELTELVDAAKVEESDEFSALYDSLKKNDQDEPGDSFVAINIKNELKNVDKESIEYEILAKVNELINNKISLNKDIAQEETKLKQQIEERILNLTNNEIDNLVYEKWFGNMTDLMLDLVSKPLKTELNTLELLNNRYSETLTTIDLEINALEEELKVLLNDLEVN